MTTLRDSEKQALMKLLADDDRTVQRLLTEQFVVMGDDGVAFLEEAAHTGSAETQAGAKHILRSIREQEAQEKFAHFCATCGDHFNLEQASWQLAKTRYPELDETAYTARLDQMATEMRARLTGREAPRATIEVCNRYLFHKLGFRGNRDDYHDPDNSYLNRVLDRRLGIPISLSILYLALGQRLKLALAGINMPGHFLIKWQSPTTEFFVDPFQAGRMLEETHCRQMCNDFGFAFHPAMLLPATDRQILLRACRNLQTIYMESDLERAEQVGRFVALLSRA